jgi:hypothetical protein
MRDDLVGYLVDALEPHEKMAVESQLGRDGALQKDLEVLRRKLAVLEADHLHYDPPLGLAERTCEFVASRIDVALAPPAPPRPRWRIIDFAVAAAVFLAASTLFLPKLQQSRFAAQVTGCQNNLQALGRSLAQFAHLNDGRFPVLVQGDRQLPAGVYATRLSQHGLLTEPQVVVCPSSPQADQQGGFHVPGLQEVENAPADQLVDLFRAMGGSYGYNLGYLSDGRYQPTKNLQRSTFALMADAPDVEKSRGQLSSFNHGRGGQNVLFEDGHVRFLTTCTADGCRDHIYLNDEGEPTAGVHRDDAVIGPSFAHPLPAGPANSR